jgi:hypothetical protein
VTIASTPGASARRRQRSVRVTVAVSLLAAATALVVLALPTQSAVWLSSAAVAAIVLSWAALRMMWTEVLQTRREHARERAAQAATYKRLFSERAEEHASFTTHMTDNLASAQQQVHELAGRVQQEQVLRAEAESSLESTTGKLVAAHKRVIDLEGQVVRLQAEAEAAADDALASWEAARIDEAARVETAVSSSHTA